MAGLVREAGRTGAKERDAWWTVLATDPLALPLTRAFASRGWFTPDQISLMSILLGAGVGVAFALGTRAGLVVGALLFQAAFLLDCVDGKLARALARTSTRGKALDRLSDASRRVSGSFGLTVWLYVSGNSSREIWWAIAFGFLYSFYAETGGADKLPDMRAVRRWEVALARRRLLPHPTTPDLEAIVFVVGPLFGTVVPALVVGFGLTVIAIVLTAWRLLRSGDLAEDEARAVIERRWFVDHPGSD